MKDRTNCITDNNKNQTAMSVKIIFEGVSGRCRVEFTRAGLFHRIRFERVSSMVGYCKEFRIPVRMRDCVSE